MYGSDDLPVRRRVWYLYIPSNPSDAWKDLAEGICRLTGSCLDRMMSTFSRYSFAFEEGSHLGDENTSAFYCNQIVILPKEYEPHFRSTEC